MPLSGWWLIPPGALAALCLIRRRRRRQAKRFTLPPQEEHPVGEPREAGGGAPLMHGVRVLELANTVAGPLTGRVLADLGAEVVKVEDEKGDYWRKMLLEYEPGRPFGTCFEQANFNKSSVVLNLRDPAAVTRLKTMMREADVFLTNLRLPALESIRDEDGKGLDWATVRGDMPHLVYAHLTAWGLTGPEVGHPGYDLGAFWTMTGMSALVHPEGMYTMYPFGFGDTTASSLLVAGVAAALRHRVATGEGHLVESSLLRAGLWSLGPWLLDEHERAAAEAAPPRIPRYAQLPAADPAWATYRTREGRHVAVADPDASAVDLLRALDPAAPTRADARADPYAAAAAAAAAADLPALTARLRAAGIAHLTLPHVTDAMVLEGKGLTDTPEFAERGRNAGCFVGAEGVSDVVRWVRMPFDASCSAEHGALRRRAPVLGAHTESFLRRRWAPRHEAAALPRATPGAGGAGSAEGGVLAGVRVVELSGFDVACAAAAAQLADLGAEVTKVEHQPGGDPWRRRHPSLWRQLNRGKRARPAAGLAAAAAEVLRLLRDADVFLTNLPQAELEAAGLGYNTVRAAHPRVVYGLQTPFGVGADDAGGGDVTAWWGLSGIAAGTHYAPMAELGSRMPCQLGSIIASSHLLAGVMCGVFHQRRTGEGQLIDMNHLRAGLWGCMQPFGLTQFEPAKLIAFRKGTMQAFRDEFAVASANSFRTRDGMWVQLLGANFRQHVPQVIAALDIKPVWLRVIRTFFCECLPDRHSKTKVEKFTPMFRVINRALNDAVGRLRWDELREKLDRGGVWYCHVNMPAQALRYEQASAVGAYTRGGAAAGDGGLLVNAPVQFAGGLAPSYRPGDFSVAHLPKGPAPPPA